MQTVIPILYAGNERIFDGILISVLSVIKYHTSPVHIYLATMDLSDLHPGYTPLREEQRRYLEEVCRAVSDESRVTLIDMGEHYRATMLHSPNAETSYTPYCFLRLYADRVKDLPERLIYLDTDTVLCGDIEELYRVDLAGAELGGVRDFYGHRFFGMNYLNSGVLLLDLKKIRETGLFRRAIEACAAKKIFLPDQTAINRLVKRKRILPRRFNEQKREKPDTLIRHFSMDILWLPYFRTRNIKPWQVDRVHEVLHLTRYDDILNDYLRRKQDAPHLFGVGL